MIQVKKHTEKQASTLSCSLNVEIRRRVELSITVNRSMIISRQWIFLNWKNLDILSKFQYKIPNTNTNNLPNTHRFWPKHHDFRTFEDDLM